MNAKPNPYLPWVAAFDAWSTEGKALPLGGLRPQTEAAPESRNATALIFAPHPDDECIIGALPLRLAREASVRIVNIAVTLGSNPERRAGRWEELQAACAYLGWPVESATPGGLERITPNAAEDDPARWHDAVLAIASKIEHHQPAALFFPHLKDWNGTHIGTHRLVMDALATMPGDFHCLLAETEFWAAQSDPNLMVESTVAEVAELCAATGFHVGEVKRNPYHLTLPAWMQDNVRRGGELVGGQGGHAPAYRFATLYRASLWRGGGRHPLPDGAEKFLSAGPDLTCNWWREVDSWK